MQNFDLQKKLLLGVVKELKPRRITKIKYLPTEKIFRCEIFMLDSLGFQKRPNPHGWVFSLQMWDHFSWDVNKGNSRTSPTKFGPWKCDVGGILWAHDFSGGQEILKLICPVYREVGYEPPYGLFGHLNVACTRFKNSAGSWVPPLFSFCTLSGRHRLHSEFKHRFDYRTNFLKSWPVSFKSESMLLNFLGW